MNNIEILKAISYVQRDNGEHFIVNEKLDRIKKIISTCSDYKEIYSGNLTSVWAKRSHIDMPVLLTSHIDNVKDIRHPFTEESVVDKIGPVLHGTFDNMSTNAALVDIMINQNVPDNIVFCFDGDEETGQCRGLKEAVKFIKENDDMGDIACIVATDVTDEGFNGKKEVEIISNKTGLPVINDKTGKIRTEWQNDYSMYKMFSLENMSGTRTFQENFCKEFLKYHTDDFDFHPHPSEGYKVPDCMKDVIGSSGFCDEAFTIRELNLNGLSICLPILGPMHKDVGCITRPDQYNAYCNDLGQIVSMIAIMDKEKLLGLDSELEALHPEPRYLYSNYTSDINGQLSISDYMAEYRDWESSEDGLYNSTLMAELSDYIGDTEDETELCEGLERYLEDVCGYEEYDITDMINGWKECFDYNYSSYSDFNYSFRDFVLEQMVNEFGLDESEYDYDRE